MSSPLATASPPGGHDLVDDLVRGPGRLAFAVHRPADVVDDDLGAVRSEQQRVLAADAPARAGDDADASLAEC